MIRNPWAFALLASIATSMGLEPAGDGPNDTAPARTSPSSVTIVVAVPLGPSGEVDLALLVERIAERTGVEPPPAAPIRLPATGVAGALTRTLLAESLGPSSKLVATNGELIVTLDVARPEPEVWRPRLASIAERAAAEAALRDAYGLRPRDSYRPNDPSRPTVCLVHGLNSTSGSFRNLTPHLEAAGYGVIVYDYPVNRDLGESGRRFARDWKALREQTGDELPWAILTHSMGGLLARDYVEGPEFLGDVEDLILIGPPNSGATLARLQTVMQLMEGVRGVREGAIHALGDGLGESADDILPASDFLQRLNGRPRREGVSYHILAGSSGFLTADARRELEARLGLVTRATGPLGRLARVAIGDLSSGLDELTEGTGDGCVALASTILEGAPDPVVIPANHVELIRGPLLYPEPGPVVSMPYILLWLPDPEAPNP